MTSRSAAFAAAFAAAVAVVPSQASAQAASNQVLPGGKSGQPIDIDAGKLDYFDKEQKLIYTGSVVAVQGASRLKASTLTIFLLPKEEGETSGPSANAQVRRMEAAGPVTLTSKDQVGTGDSGIYEKGDNKVTLIGNVTLTQGPNVTKGDRLVYDLNTAQAVVQGRVRSMFIPNNSNNGTAASASAGGSTASATPATPASKTAAKSAPKGERHPKDLH